MNYNYTTVYVGMDVHKSSFTLCCYTNEKEEPEYCQKTAADFTKVLNYINAMRRHYGEEAHFVCGYEAGCLGYTLYHELTDHGVECIILAPTTMAVPSGKKKIKTDKRDAALIGRCLAHHDYSPVHIPTKQDDQVKEYIRMRDAHKKELKKVKQEILAYLLRHGYVYDMTKHNWTQAHLKWLRSLKLDGIYQEVLSEYLISYDQLTDKIERFDQRIEELSREETYQENVHKLTCFLGVKTHTALAVLVEVGDFKRFASAKHFSAYLGLVPGESTSAEKQNRFGITKAGNSHVRKLLTESAQSYTRGQVGYKSKEIKERQKGNPPEVIAYADKANERLRRKYYRLTLGREKKGNVAKTAIARELACFMWGMMTGNVG